MVFILRNLANLCPTVEQRNPISLTALSLDEFDVDTADISGLFQRAAESEDRRGGRGREDDICDLSSMSSGVYFFNISFDGHNESRKMVLMK